MTETYEWLQKKRILYIRELGDGTLDESGALSILLARTLGHLNGRQLICIKKHSKTKRFSLVFVMPGKDLWERKGAYSVVIDNPKVVLEEFEKKFNDILKKLRAFFEVKP